MSTSKVRNHQVCVHDPRTDDIAGCGVLVSETHALTCRHVVAKALGDEEDAVTGRWVAIGFPFIPGGGRIMARAEFLPGDSRGELDLMGLELSDPPPAPAEPAQFAEIDLSERHEFFLYGFPQPDDRDGVISKGYLVDERLDDVQIEATTDIGLPPGFSGAPVWSDNAGPNGAFIGLARSARDSLAAKTGFMYPSRRLFELWDRIGGYAYGPSRLPAVGGAVAADCPFYVERQTDADASEIVKAEAFTLAIRGLSLTGKSPLLERLSRQVRSEGRKVARVDFRGIFGEDEKADRELCYRRFFRHVGRQVGFPDETENREFWLTRSGKLDGTRYLYHHLLEQLSAPLVLIMDDADHLLSAKVTNDFFAMLRAWHDDRSKSKHKRLLKRFGMVLSYATDTEAYLSYRQSPFTVATRLFLDELTLDQVLELRDRHKDYGDPPSDADVRRLYGLVGGHPYLVRTALHEVTSGRMGADDLFERALFTGPAGPFGPQLRRLDRLLDNESDLLSGLAQVIQGGARPEPIVVDELQALGLIKEKTSAPEPDLWAKIRRWLPHRPSGGQDGEPRLPPRDPSPTLIPSNGLYTRYFGKRVGA